MFISIKIFGVVKSIYLFFNNIFEARVIISKADNISKGARIAEVVQSLLRKLMLMVGKGS